MKRIILTMVCLLSSMLVMSSCCAFGCKTKKAGANTNTTPKSNY